MFGTFKCIQRWFLFSCLSGSPCPGSITSASFASGDVAQQSREPHSGGRLPAQPRWDPAAIADKPYARGRLRGLSWVCYFHLLKNTVYFPFVVLKAIYHYWILFSGVLTEWKVKVVLRLPFVGMCFFLFREFQQENRDPCWGRFVAKQTLEG